MHIFFWISGVDRTELLSGFGRVARILRCGMSLMRPEEIAKRVLQWLEGNESWLLIVDNVDDLDVIAGYLPQSNGSGHTIIMTRNTNTAGIPATGLEVREMDQYSGVSFLLQRIGAVDPSTEIREDVYQIVDTLGGLPLAIEQAAGYCISKSPKIFRRTFPFSRGLDDNCSDGNFWATTYILKRF